MKAWLLNHLAGLRHCLCIDLTGTFMTTCDCETLRQKVVFRRKCKILQPAIPVLELHETWLLKISLQRILFLSSPRTTFCQSPVGIVNLQRFPYLAIGKPCSKVKDPSYRRGILIWMLPFLDFTFPHFCWSSPHLLPLFSFKKQGKNLLKYSFATDTTVQCGV